MLRFAANREYRCKQCQDSAITNLIVRKSAFKWCFSFIRFNFFYFFFSATLNSDLASAAGCNLRHFCSFDFTFTTPTIGFFDTSGRHKIRHPCGSQIIRIYRKNAGLSYVDRHGHEKQERIMRSDSGIKCHKKCQTNITTEFTEQGDAL